MEKNRLEQRMYGIVPYNLSPIQQGIQFGHAVVEYGLENSLSMAYLDWAKYDKTFIILNGGTTNDKFKDGEYLGSLNNHRLSLINAGIKIADFEEPDLNDALTAVVFLVDERVFNKKKYPDYEGTCYEDGTPTPTAYYEWKMKFADTEKEADQIVFLRDFLKPLKLA